MSAMSVRRLVTSMARGEIIPGNVVISSLINIERAKALVQKETTWRLKIRKAKPTAEGSAVVKFANAKGERPTNDIDEGERA